LRYPSDSGRIIVGLTREEKAAERTARETEKATREAAKAAARVQQQFDSSVQGRARAAFASGDGFFEIELDLRATGNLNSHGGTGFDGGSLGGHKPRSGRMDVLSVIESEGWELAFVDHVFVMTGEDSRDKFMASGQRTSVRGKIIGIYLFRRSESAVPTPPGSLTPR
jgi:hypothetical protein